MKIGVPKEIKRHEYRVGVTPGCARSYIEQGHSVAVESGAGEGAGFADDDYSGAGAEILTDVGQLYGLSEMIIKVKEPLAEEFELFREGQILYIMSGAGFPLQARSHRAGYHIFDPSLIENPNDLF